MTYERLRVKAKVAAGEHLLGVLVRMPAEEMVEMAGVVGFDFVVIDCEHGPADVSDLRRHITAAEVNDLAVVVRVGSAEPALTLRALDQGAAGILAPHLDTAEEARAIVDAVHYPPLGHRGFATYTRTGAFGTVDPQQHQRSYLDQTLVLGMIESPLGVRNVADIVGVEGLDAIMIGAADLRASTTEADPDPSESIATVNAELAAQGAVRMDIVGTPEQARAAFDAGAQLVVYNLTQATMAFLAQLNDVRPAANF